MRITKKFAGSSCIGKQVYTPCDSKTIDPEILNKVNEELKDLEEKFRARVDVQRAMDLYPLSNPSYPGLQPMAAPRIPPYLEGIPPEYYSPFSIIQPPFMGPFMKPFPTAELTGLPYLYPTPAALTQHPAAPKIFETPETIHPIGVPPVAVPSVAIPSALMADPMLLQSFPIPPNHPLALNYKMREMQARMMYNLPPYSEFKTVESKTMYSEPADTISSSNQPTSTETSSEKTETTSKLNEESIEVDAIKNEETKGTEHPSSAKKEKEKTKNPKAIGTAYSPPPTNNKIAQKPKELMPPKSERKSKSSNPQDEDATDLLLNFFKAAHNNNTPQSDVKGDDKSEEHNQSRLISQESENGTKSTSSLSSLTTNATNDSHGAEKRPHSELDTGKAEHEDNIPSKKLKIDT
jgi:hypothetical protein